MSDSSWHSDLRELQRAYRERLRQKLEELDGLLARARLQGADADALKAARSLAHMLKGSAGCYGFDAASSALAQVEAGLEGLLAGTPPGAGSAWRRIDGGMARLEGLRR